MWIGIENDAPVLDGPMEPPSGRVEIIPLIPTSSPARFHRGPPELPGLTSASCWMAFVYLKSPWRLRSVPLTTPSVATQQPSAPRKKGLPVAMTHCPSTRDWLLPNFAGR